MFKNAIKIATLTLFKPKSRFGRLQSNRDSNNYGTGVAPHTHLLAAVLLVLVNLRQIDVGIEGKQTFFFA